MRIALSTSFTVIFLCSCTPPADLPIVAAIEDANSKAPFMINDETRFDRASMAGKSIVFNYTMLSMEHSEYDFARLETEFAPSQTRAICEIFVPQGYYQKGFSITYKYYDRNQKHVIDIVTNDKVCNS